MEDRVRPSRAVRIFGPFIFIIGAPLALFWFFHQTYQLISHWASDAILFDKGAFYMIGVGLGLLVLGLGVIQEYWLDRTLTDKQAGYIGKAALVAVALLPIAPNLAHFVTDRMLKSDGYVVCEEASHQWRFVRDIVYIQPTVNCEKDLRDRLLGRTPSG